MKPPETTYSFRDQIKTLPMATIRDLKKDINHVLGEIIEMTLDWEKANPDADRKASTAIVDEDNNPTLKYLLMYTKIRLCKPRLSIVGYLLIIPIDRLVKVSFSL